MEEGKFYFRALKKIRLGEERGRYITTIEEERYDTNKYKSPFRVGRKQGRAVLDSMGLLLVFFEEEKQAELYCKYLNEN